MPKTVKENIGFLSVAMGLQLVASSRIWVPRSLRGFPQLGDESRKTTSVPVYNHFTSIFYIFLYNWVACIAIKTIATKRQLTCNMFIKLCHFIIPWTQKLCFGLIIYCVILFYRSSILNITFTRGGNNVENSILLRRNWFDKIFLRVTYH